jgi:hypothetical protein
MNEIQNSAVDASVETEPVEKSVNDPALAALTRHLDPKFVRLAKTEAAEFDTNEVLIAETNPPATLQEAHLLLKAVSALPFGTPMESQFRDAKIKMATGHIHRLSQAQAAPRVNHLAHMAATELPCDGRVRKNMLSELAVKYLAVQKILGALTVQH